MAIISYCPELGEAKPTRIDGNVTLSHNGKHYFIETPLTLSGIGIAFEQKLRASNLTDQGQYKAGWNVYRVTNRAMNSLRQSYDFARESLLD